MKRTIKKIIIHCSATPNGRRDTLSSIDAGHKARGFRRNSQYVRSHNPELKHIGYHRIILADGTRRTGRHLEEIGSHVRGNNSDSIGVMMMGTDKFSEQQWIGLREEIMQLAREILNKKITSVEQCLNALKEAGITIGGHRDFSPDLNGDGQVTRNEWLKICPGFSVADWIKGGMAPMKNHIIEVPNV
jgi:hypothetical protein